MPEAGRLATFGSGGNSEKFWRLSAQTVLEVARLVFFLCLWRGISAKCEIDRSKTPQNPFFDHLRPAEINRCKGIQLSNNWRHVASNPQSCTPVLTLTNELPIWQINPNFPLSIQYWLKKFTVPNLPCSTSCFQIPIKTIKLEWKIFKGLICNQERHKLTRWDGLARKASLRDNPFLPSQCLAVSRPFYKQRKTIKSVWKNIHSSRLA